MIRLIACFVVFSQCVYAQELASHWGASKKLAHDRNEIPNTVPIENSACLPKNADNTTKHNFSCWPFSVESIIDKENMILRFGKRDVSYYWLTGYPTEGLADNDKVSLIGLVKVVEPKSYITALGTKKTLKTFSILTKEELDKEKLEQEEKQIAERMRYAATLQLKDGTEIEAVAIQSQKGIITLVTKDKKKREVKIADLTPKALAEVRKQLKK